MVPDISLRAGVPRLISGLGMSFLLPSLLVSKSCEVLGRAWLGFCISFDLPFFLA